MIAGRRLRKKCWFLTFSSESSLVMNDISDGKCVLSSCKLDVTQKSSAGAMSSQRAKYFDTNGTAASVEGRSFSESHYFTKFLSNFDSASFRNIFGKALHVIFFSKLLCDSLRFMNS